jgi:preprotein translocase SecE subunit
MEAVSKKTDAKDEMADEEETPDVPKPDKAPPGYPGAVRAPIVSASTGGGYFRIYKKGQGYWTRMGTVAGVVLIGVLTAWFLWDEKVNLRLGENGGYILVGVFCLVYAGLGFHNLNKPRNVDFLIATDSEMKKVNWTTKNQLVGSTKVVIGFVILMAVLLFVYDLFFQWLFWLLGVLKTPPLFLNKH